MSPRVPILLPHLAFDDRDLIQGFSHVRWDVSLSLTSEPYAGLAGLLTGDLRGSDVAVLFRFGSHGQWTGYPGSP